MKILCRSEGYRRFVTIADSRNIPFDSVCTLSKVRPPSHLMIAYAILTRAKHRFCNSKKVLLFSHISHKHPMFLLNTSLSRPYYIDIFYVENSALLTGGALLAQNALNSHPTDGARERPVEDGRGPIHPYCLPI